MLLQKFIRRNCLYSYWVESLMIKKVITLFRDGVFFNTFIYGPLGVICENITYEKIPELEISNINDHFQKDEFYFSIFEVSLLLFSILACEFLFNSFTRVFVINRNSATVFSLDV